jgi:molecular chaperone DnaK (HSP70)
LGGGTFDVTILSLEFDDEKIFEVLSTDGDTNLGGNDFDQELSNLAIKYFYDEFDFELEGNKIACCKVKKACEKAKKILSEQNSTTIELRRLYLGRDLIMTFTRKKFEEICKNLFDRCLEVVDNALEIAKLKENDINEVVLIGGSTRIPYVREMLRNKFKNSKLCYDINPDEAVSIGAAIQGAIIIQKKDEKIKDINLFDVTPFSLGVKLNHDEMDVIIKRNTVIPIKKKIYSTVKNNQTTVEIRIYEGEDKNVKKIV